MLLRTHHIDIKLTFCRRSGGWNIRGEVSEFPYISVSHSISSAIIQMCSKKLTRLWTTIGLNTWIIGWNRVFDIATHVDDVPWFLYRYNLLLLFESYLRFIESWYWREIWSMTQLTPKCNVRNIIVDILLLCLLYVYLCWHYIT